MKKLILILLLFTSFQVTNAFVLDRYFKRNIEFSSAFPKTYGNIKSIKITEQSPDIKFGEIQKWENDFHSYEYLYNTKGQLEKIITYFDDNISSVIRLSYDSNNRLLSQNDYNSNGDLNSRYTYTYIGANQVSEKNSEDSDSELFTLDSQGKIIECSGNLNDGKIYVYKYYYNSDGTCAKRDYSDFVKKSSYFGRSEMIVDDKMVSIYEYDNKKNFVSKSDREKKPDTIYKYQYDSIGNCVRMHEFSLHNSNAFVGEIVTDKEYILTKIIVRSITYF